MSLYSFVSLGNVTLPTGGIALVPGAQMIVRVEEEQMLLVLNFQGQVSGVTAEAATLHFYVDGAAATVLPQVVHTFLTGQLTTEVNMSLPLSLSKGEHTVSLWANADSGGHAIEGTVTDCRFSATRASNAATLGQGVNSKVQLSL
ncbi:MAG: hypothetical protein AB7L09_00095 [Nitrospira sp.]